MYCRPVRQVTFANWLATTSAMSGKSPIHSSRRLVPGSRSARRDLRDWHRLWKDDGQTGSNMNEGANGNVAKQTIRPPEVTSSRFHDHRDARNACTSRIGGFPKKRLYSRLNWLGLSYPTAKAALAASSSSVSIFCRAVWSRSCF